MKKLAISLILLASLGIASAEKVIEVACDGNDATEAIRKALNEAAAYKGGEVTIKLQPGTYRLDRNNASTHLYHVSNTTSEQENPDQTKHIGIWMKDLENVTFDGNGATLQTYGEMTSFVIDNCRKVRLTNFHLDSADPSVVEITITKVGDKSLEFDVLPPTEVEVKDGYFFFKGNGWIFGDEKRVSNHTAIAQIFNPERNMTLRVESPIRGYTKAEQTGKNSIRLFFDYQPSVHPGERFQLRHSIRNEVCMFINRSADIELKDVDLNFMGNFGIVSQFTENITFDNIHCEPLADSGRTNAGFADFLQFSSCKGHLRVLNSRFSGSHDDPINIHGTHLQVVETAGDNKLVVAYRHPQTFGFPPFYPGDELALVDRETLNYVGKTAIVKSVKNLDDYRYELVLDKNISSLTDAEVSPKYAVENLSWTPDVEIRGNYFSRTPTRAILITTKGKSVIADNTFFHIPMASVLVADDANSWYESGPVTDLTITNNVFIDCESPVIYVNPEIRKFDKPVHSNIVVTNNKFIDADAGSIDIKASEDITIEGNLFTVSPSVNMSIEDLVKTQNVRNIVIEKNRID